MRESTDSERRGHKIFWTLMTECAVPKTNERVGGLDAFEIPERFRHCPLQEVD